MKKTNKSFIAPIIILLLSISLFAVIFYIDMGCACEGWNLINPLCWARSAICNVGNAIMKLTFFVTAIILFIIGISVLVKRLRK